MAIVFVPEQTVPIARRLHSQLPSGKTFVVDLWHESGDIHVVASVDGVTLESLDQLDDEDRKTLRAVILKEGRI